MAHMDNVSDRSAERTIAGPTTSSPSISHEDRESGRLLFTMSHDQSANVVGGRRLEFDSMPNSAGLHDIVNELGLNKNAYGQADQGTVRDFLNGMSSAANGSGDLGAGGNGASGSDVAAGGTGASGGDDDDGDRGGNGGHGRHHGGNQRDSAGAAEGQGHSHSHRGGHHCGGDSGSGGTSGNGSPTGSGTDGGSDVPAPSGSGSGAGSDFPPPNNGGTTPGDSTTPSGTTPGDNTMPSGTTPGMTPGDTTPPSTTPGDNTTPSGTTPGDNTTPSGTTPGDNTTPSGTTPGDNTTPPSTTPGDNTIPTGTTAQGFAGPNSPEVQAVLSRVQFDPGVSDAVKQGVIQAIQDSTLSTLNALNQLGTTIEVQPQGLGGGTGAYFDPGANKIMISGDNPQMAPEFTQHELFHAADMALGITGGFGNGGQQWQQLAAADFARLDPNSLGLQIGFVDPPNINGVGSGDVAAELASYVAGNDSSGTGRALAQAYPDLAQYIEQSLGVNGPNPNA